MGNPIRALSSVMRAAALARQGGSEARLIALHAAQLQLSNVKAESVDYQGRPAIRLTALGPDTLNDAARFAVVPGLDFGDGTIEVEMAGDTDTGANPAFRACTGIAFRLDREGSSYEAFYLRLKNGRSQDQRQRNHSTQYIAPPEFLWQRLREQTPGLYESYVDVVTSEWTKAKVEVRGLTAKLYVNGASQPALIVNDLKHGVSHGGVAFWIGPGSISYFSNLRVTGTAP